MNQSSKRIGLAILLTFCFSHFVSLAGAQTCTNPTVIGIQPSCQPQKVKFATNQTSIQFPSSSAFNGKLKGIFNSYWFQFIATSPDVQIEMRSILPGRNWTGMGYDVLTGNCGALVEVSSEFQPLLVSNTYTQNTLVLGIRNFL